MRSVFVFSTLPRDVVTARLDEVAVRSTHVPDDQPVEWIMADALWIGIHDEPGGLYDDWEPEEVEALSVACGGRPSWALAADVSGRIPGHDEVRALVLLTCGPGGHAMDDYSDHVWTDSEVAAGISDDGNRRFFTPPRSAQP